MNKIIVLFKTHLDLGFTGFAEDVRRQYIEKYIPHALSVARQMRGEKERFIWTVGSWILREALEDGYYQEELEEAIKAGDIRWHGLPFTTHTELMDKELFCYGLGISKSLDEQFHKHTIAAKMTDVPGHTRAMIPLLCGAGIRFLHLGVNPASTRPKVPALFRWKAESGEEILVMYNNDYGELTEIGNSGVAVYFAHTGDNLGPQSPEAVRTIYEKLHETYPEAEILAGTLEDVAEAAIKETDLPVITDEIGDTWIHGAGSDPRKISSYRALLRLKEHLSKEEMNGIYRELLMVPEHTWGRNEEVTLGRYLPGKELTGEHRYFDRKEFEKMRPTGKFWLLERSWDEQRTYVDGAVSSLDSKAEIQAKAAISEYKRERTDHRGWEEYSPLTPISIDGFSVSVGENGAISHMEKNGIVLADENHPLAQFFYEIFCPEDYKRFKKQYVISEETWAKEDFGKLGLEKVVSRHESFLPEVAGIFLGEHSLVISMKLPKRATELYGGMEELELLLKFEETKVFFDFAWFGKKANRIPEASWLGFETSDPIVAMEKMGEMVDPSAVASCGNRSMHAVDRRICLAHTEWETLDTPLFCPEKPALLNFTDETPKMDRGFFMNLHNNVWGTNFRMWYDEDARFRFVLKF